MQATRTFKDDKGTVRKNGEEWLITMEDTDAHIPNVHEEVWSKACLHIIEVHLQVSIHIDRRLGDQVLSDKFRPAKMVARIPLCA